MSKCHPAADSAISSLLKGIDSQDSFFIKRFLSLVDTSYLQPRDVETAFKAIIKAIMFFEFLNEGKKLEVKDAKTGKRLSYLDVFGNEMS